MRNGIKQTPTTHEEMLKELSRQTGGIPDFAKDMLQQMGMSKKMIDEADEIGRKESKL